MLTQNSTHALSTYYSDSADVEKALQNPLKIQQFRDMVIMHLKKDDVSTKVISSDKLSDLREQIILPINSFK